jgi:hypothetical protein
MGTGHLKPKRRAFAIAFFMARQSLGVPLNVVTSTPLRYTIG